MTGNKNAWRAPLAGLASVAMIATMGVAASTANAAVATGKAGVTSSAAYDLSVNGTKVTNGNQTLVNSGKALTVVDGNRYDGYRLTGWTLKQLDGTVVSNDTKLVDTWEYTLDAQFTKSLLVKFEDNASADQEVVPGDYVEVPAGSDVYEYEGKLYGAGEKIRVNAEGVLTIDKYEGAKVTFNADGGKFANGKDVSYSKISDKKVSSIPSDPAKDGYTFAGWKLSGSYSVPDGEWIDGEDGNKYVEDLKNVTFNGDATVTAVWNNVTKSTVVFNYGGYADAPEDVSVQVAPNETIAVPSEKPVREGYLFKGWAKADGTVYNASTLAGDFFAFPATGTATFTLKAVWQKADKLDKADALKALRYVVAVNDTKAGVSGAKETAKAFTSASWKAYTTVYKKALNEYNAAQWDKWNGSMKDETAKAIVDELQAGWKDLRFNNGDIDTTLDGTNYNNGGAELVYRLATPDGARHFMTADEHEVIARTNVISGASGWKNEPASSFRMVNRKVTEWVKDAAEGDQGTPDTSLGYEIDGDDTIAVTLPLVKTVTRLYNSVNQEHLYTTDGNEVKTLTNGSNDWSVDSSAANLYTPALYSTSREVARFYNPATGLHFYTTDKAEINFWTVQHPGIWTKETTGIYAL